MDNIIEPNEHFPFSKLSLTVPTGIQGGAYFTKIQFNNKPLYIQTTKSATRQGIVKSGKKYYCDLLFDKNSEVLIQWLETLEETCQKLVYEKSDTWFQNTLEMNDVEGAFNPTVRVYKSGKFYLVRVNIKNSHTTGEPTVKIYDENEIPLGMNDIHPETNIISILEIQGIKFTSRNFQIEIELKQMMVLNEPIFDNCLIKKNGISSQVSQEREMKHLENMKIQEPLLEVSSQSLESLGEEREIQLEEKKDIENQDDNDNAIQLPSIETPLLSDIRNEVTEDIKELSIPFPEEDEDEDLKEITIQLDKNDQSITLKKPNQVYYELYKQAKKKAKQAKKDAIIAYLEAKNIKKTYMLDDLDDSDIENEDEEGEMNGFLESEFENLDDLDNF